MRLSGNRIFEVLEYPSSGGWLVVLSFAACGITVYTELGTVLFFLLNPTFRPCLHLLSKDLLEVEARKITLNTFTVVSNS